MARTSAAASRTRDVPRTAEPPDGEPRGNPAPPAAQPPAPVHLVARPNLMALLDRSAQHPLTLVSAPAGTGKTVAVSSWARSRRASQTIVWMTLSSLDLRAGIPWARLAGQLIRADGDIGGDWAGEQSSIGALGRAIAARSSPLTLILDCALDLSGADATRLDQLLSEATGRLRLVVLTRADVPMPLHRYRRQHALAEIRMADLAFTTDETRDLFARRGIELSSEELGLVLTRTRGWAAGLMLMALALAHTADRGRAIHELSGDSGPIAEYLLAEVLDTQSSSARDLLLHTSVVETLRPGLVDELAGSGATARLAELAGGNGFVEPVGSQRDWYHYHPLFRELLRAQLAYREPEKAARLHRVAADWLARAGRIDEAVQTAVDAGLWSRASGYVVDQLAIAQVLTPSPTVLRQLVAPLPADTPTPAAALVRAALAVSDGRYAEAADELRRATARSGTASPAAAAASAAAITAARASMTDDAEVVLTATAAAERALAAACGQPAPPRPELAIMLDTVRARALLERGQLPEAAEACTRAVSGGMRAGFEWAHVECVGYLALVAAWRGEHRKAVRLARLAIALNGRSAAPLPHLRSVSEAALAWVYTETDDRHRAGRHAAAAATENATAPGAAFTVTLALVHSRLRRAQGDLRGARAPLDECRRRNQLAAWWAARIAGDEAIIADLEAHRAASAGPGSRLADGTTALGPTLPEQVGRLLAEAHDCVRRGKEDEAVEALDRALRLAAPERLRRPFREAPSDVRRLLRTRRDIAQRHGWLDTGRDRPASAPTSQPTTATDLLLAERLTAKERVVLGHMAQLLTTEEIAGTMFVSVNTIRTHVRNILRKLGTTRRNQAIRRARELGILEAGCRSGRHSVRDDPMNARTARVPLIRPG